MTRAYVKILLAAGVTIIGNGLRAQSVAFVSQTKLYEQVKGYAAKAKEMDNLQQSYNQQIKQKENAINNAFQELIKPYAPKDGETPENIKSRMNKGDADKLSVLMNENKVLQETITAYKNDYAGKYSSVLEPIQKKIGSAVQEYADKKGISMIWFIESIENSAIYYNKKNDVTDALISEINKTF